MTLLLLHTLVDHARDNPTGPWAEGLAVVTVLAGSRFRFRRNRRPACQRAPRQRHKHAQLQMTLI
jgi:hypothetical protein